MLLSPARVWSLPANWQAHQALAIRGQMDFPRCNYNLDRVGLIVRNKKLLLEMHDTKCKPSILPSYVIELNNSAFAGTDWELKQFTTENLGKAHGTARAIQDKQAGVTWKEEFDGIPSGAYEVAKIAVRNWADINRHIHPALLVSSQFRKFSFLANHISN